MSTTSRIKIVHNDDLSWDMRADTLCPQEAAERIARYMDKLAVGCGQGSLDIQVGDGTGVAASATLTLASVVANDTCVVGTQTFTAKASPSTANQFLVGADDSATATSLAAKIAAHASLADVVTASAVGAVVTVSCTKLGLIGNMITLTGSADITANHATLVGGVNQTAKIHHLGL